MSTNKSTLARPNFSPVRRVVTGHIPEGKAVIYIVDDALIESHPFGPAPSLFGYLFWMDVFPSDNDDEFKDIIKEHPKDMMETLSVL
ncbi:hypothetical protein EW145_g7306 [Phellinidium pouzarii]|uniref:Uncharacterized protein n=1 Tax=Phellinidium pouzarii TaxID=167371 RepID=A0A4S4KL69_9AGAM|nr:hypothetical protein EW145_g7306 [Phellinidium pouzarii]